MRGRKRDDRGWHDLTLKLQRLPKKSKFKENPNFILQNIEKQMVPCKSTAEEVSFEWSHHRILLIDSKIRTTLHVSIIDSGSNMVDLESRDGGKASPTLLPAHDTALL